MTNTSFTVECPCCRAKLTLDPELRAIVSHEPPPPTRSIDNLGAAFGKLRSKSEERERAFKEQLRAESEKGKLLDRKFQEGLKRAKDSPDPPPRRYDYD